MNTVKRSPSQNRTKLEAQIVSLWESGTSVSKIAGLVGCRNSVPREVILKFFGKDSLKNRKSDAYQQSKLGDSNPMKGKKGAEHHYWKCCSDDQKGYLTMVSPDWYEGSEKRVFVHRVVWAFWHGYNRMPDHLVIHHIDENTKNNSPDNLQALTNSEHTRLHQEARRRNDYSERKYTQVSGSAANPKGL